MALEFEPWYRETRGDLAAALARALADEDVAGDAVDEAFAHAVERWSHVATLRSPNGWVYTVAFNVARRTYRRRSMEAERSARLAADASTPEASLASTADLIAQLPPRQAAAVRLRLDGLTEAEIAASLGVARSTVSSSLRSAFRTLARQLRPTPTDGSDGGPMDLTLARVRRGHPDGVEVTYLDADITEKVRYGELVVDRIRVRRDDLVAVDVAVDPPEVVWRWWHGRVLSIDGRTATCRRPAGGEPGHADVDVHVPPELAAALRPGTDVWFGRVDDDLVAVAVAGRPETAGAHLPSVAAAYG